MADDYQYGRGNPEDARPGGEPADGAHSEQPPDDLEAVDQTTDAYGQTEVPAYSDQPAPSEARQPYPPPLHTHAPGLLQASGLYCVRCGYNLTGVTIGSNCPECDTPVDMSITALGSGQSSGKAIASMVLGIVAIPSCMFYGLPALILGALAMIFGYLVLNEVKEGKAPKSSKQMAIAGMVCGGVAIVLVVVFVIFIIFAIAMS